MPTKPSATLVKRRPGRPSKSAVDAVGAIRKAALNVFARNGFTGASIADIAREAGVAKPLIHYHFASKDELWQAAVAEACTALQSEMSGLQPQLLQSEPRQAIRKIALQLMLFAAHHPQLVRIVVDETGKEGPRTDWLHAHFLLPAYALSNAILETLARQLQAPAPAPRAQHLIPIVVGAMNFPFLDAEVIRKAFGVDVYSEAYLERHGELLSRVLESLFLPG